MKRTLFVAVAFLVVVNASAQAPRVVNAALQQRAVSGNFAQFFDSLVAQQTKPAWVGYAVPAVPGHRAGCYGNGDWSQRGPYYLEGRPAGDGAAQDRTVKLEGDASFLVLFRVENQQVGKVAFFSPECELDGGGLPFVSLSGVAPGDSIGLLARIAEADGTPHGVARAAVAAIALHGNPAADAALERLVGPRQPAAIRSQAAFWLGNARGQRGYEILRDIVAHDLNANFRKQATSAFAQSKEPAAVDTLIQMAKSDNDPSVRGQALFWVAQKAGKKAAGAITDAIASDPESQVKERAVFALSQLPKDEGIPLLIDVARSNRDPKVRQRAMFWLGQSKDPRALAFFEQVLKAR